MLLTIHADGGGRSPKASCGWYATDGISGEFIAAEAYTLGDVSSNEAEYAGIISALRWSRTYARTNPVAGLHMVSDSQLIVCQMNGAWKAKESRLEELKHETAGLVDDLPFDVKFTWVRRSLNWEADLMATIGKQDQGVGWLLKARHRTARRRVRKAIVAISPPPKP